MSRYRNSSAYNQLLIAHIMSKTIFMKYLPSQNVPKIKNAQNLSKSGTCYIWSMAISILMSKTIFKKYLPPIHPKLVLKLKGIRIYWNLAQLIFQISRSRFWCQKLFLLNTYHLFGPNWSQNEKCSEFIETWHIRYFKYTSLNFDVKNDFFEILATY